MKLNQNIGALILALLTLLNINLNLNAAVWGDATGEGNITTTDITLFLRHILRKAPIAPLEPLSPEAFARGDIDGDGVITALDLSLIRAYIVGNPTPVPNRTGQEVSTPVVITDDSAKHITPGFVLPGNSVVAGAHTIQAGNRPLRVRVAGVRMTGTLKGSFISMLSAWYVENGTMKEIGRGVVDEQNGQSSLFTAHLFPVVSAGSSLTIFYLPTIYASSKTYPVPSGLSVGVGSMSEDAVRWEVVDAETGKPLPVSIGEVSNPVKWVMEAYPEVMVDPIVPAILEQAEWRRVLRFKIKAVGGDVKIGSFFPDVQTVEAVMRGKLIMGYRDDHYGEILRHSDPNLSFFIELFFPFTIPEGETYSFEVRGQFSFLPSGSIRTTIHSSSGPPSESEFSSFRWAPVTGGNWWNGYGVPGFPVEGITQMLTW